MVTWVLGEFESADALLDATARLRLDGHSGLDTHSPYPLHGVGAALGLPRSKVPLIALLGGVSGALIAYGFQYYTAVIDYPINVGNRAPHSPPAFVPITFEVMVLLSALAIFIGLLFLMGLPRPHHPIFEAPELRSATTHAFWVSVPLEDPVRAEQVSGRLREWGASRVSVVVDGDAR